MTTIEKVIYALNKMPNTKNVGPNGESTYDLVKELESLNKTFRIAGLLDEIIDSVENINKSQLNSVLENKKPKYLVHNPLTNENITVKEAAKLVGLSEGHVLRMLTGKIRNSTKFTLINEAIEN